MPKSALGRDCGDESLPPLQCPGRPRRQGAGLSRGWSRRRRLAHRPRAPPGDTRALWKPRHFLRHTLTFGQLWEFQAVGPAVSWAASGPWAPSPDGRAETMFIYSSAPNPPVLLPVPQHKGVCLSSVLSDLSVAFRRGWVSLLRIGFSRIIYEQKRR